MQHLDSGIPLTPFICPSWHCQEGLPAGTGQISEEACLSYYTFITVFPFKAGFYGSNIGLEKHSSIHHKIRSFVLKVGI